MRPNSGHFAPTQPEWKRYALLFTARCHQALDGASSRHLDLPLFRSRKGMGSEYPEWKFSHGFMERRPSRREADADLACHRVCAPLPNSLPSGGGWEKPRAAVPGDRRLVPVTNQLAAGKVFVHLGFAMSDTKSFSEV